jgi:hypothetical protein
MAVILLDNFRKKLLYSPNNTKGVDTESSVLLATRHELVDVTTECLVRTHQAKSSL